MLLFPGYFLAAIYASTHFLRLPNPFMMLAYEGLFLCRTAHGRLVMSWKMHWCHISNENCSIILCIIPQKGTLGTSLLLCITVNKTDENLFSPTSIYYGGEYFFMADSPHPVDFEIHFSWSEAWSMVIYIWSACNKKQIMTRQLSTYFSRPPSKYK